MVSFGSRATVEGTGTQDVDETFSRRIVYGVANEYVSGDVIKRHNCSMEEDVNVDVASGGEGVASSDV